MSWKNLTDQDGKPLEMYLDTSYVCIITTSTLGSAASLYPRGLGDKKRGVQNVGTP